MKAYKRFGSNRATENDLKKEIRIFQKLTENIHSHPGAGHCMELYDKTLYTDQNHLVLVVPLYAGGDWTAWKRKFGRNSASRMAAPDDRVFAKMLWQAWAGLDYLHSHHIVHRDLKPDNIMQVFSGIVFEDFVRFSSGFRIGGQPVSTWTCVSRCSLVRGSYCKIFPQSIWEIC